MSEQYDGDTEEGSDYEESMRRYLEEFDILDDDEVLVLYRVPEIAEDDIAGR